MSKNQSVCFVLTSHYALDDKGTKTGSWLEELASAYYRFIEHAFEISIASVRGGDAPLDPASLGGEWITEAGRRFLADEVAMRKVRNSPALSDVADRDFDALFLVGGAGTMWDFPDNAELAALLHQANSRNAVISAVCHGVSGLLNLVNGKALAAGRAVTCISNREDEMAGYDKLVPFLPETALNQIGAKVVIGEPFMRHVVADRNIVTGQNPASAPALADTVIGMLQSAKQKEQSGASHRTVGGCSAKVTNQ